MTPSSHPFDAARARSHWLTALKQHGGMTLKLAVALPLLSGMLLLAQAGLLAIILHKAITEDRSAGALLPAILSLGAVMAVRILLAHLAERAGNAAAERIKDRVRRALFTHALTQNPDWTASRSSGGLASILVEQIETFDGYFAKFLPAMVQSAFLPIAFALAVIPVDWVAGVLFLVTAPLIPVFMALVGWGAEAAGEAQAHAMSRLSGYFADRLRGLTTLALFGRGEIEAAAMRTASEDLRRGTMRVLRIAFLSSAVLEFFAALGVAGVALYVGLSFLGLVNLRFSPLSFEGGLFCLLMAPEVYQPLRLLAAHYHDRAGAKAAVTEIDRQFGELPGIPPDHSAHRPSAANRIIAREGIRQGISLAVAGLTISTPDGRAEILSNAAMSLPAGTHVAISGPSGIGKSTLLEALARMRTYEGSILVAGRELASIPEAELRERVAFLGQRPRLFHGTIADNIRFGRPEASTQELRRAAELACVASFADELPLGLETHVGEGGLGLSGGEAHRVALARLYLRDPSALLLDEPTAHLDRVTEALVLEGLLEFCAERTLIIATHSGPVCRAMERVIGIRERGLVPEAARRLPRDLDVKGRAA